LNAAKRIASDDYIPTDQDVLRAGPKSTGIYETRLTDGDSTIRLFDIVGQKSGSRKWMQSFENVTSILFVVNLANYDQLCEDFSMFQLSQTLHYFDSIVNSRWFLKTSFILLFTNVDLFKRKLPNSPLSHYFPDYFTGMRAEEYIIDRFKEVNRANRPLYNCRIGEPNGWPRHGAVLAAVRDTVMMSNMVSCGLVSAEEWAAKC
jgi:guanine nucleotide-binding protein G(i) subunit alpha